MNESTLTTSTAGLFIEESDDEDQDDDLDLNTTQNTVSTQQLMNNNNNNNNNDNDQFDDNKEEEEEELESDDDEFPISDVIELLTIAWRNEKLAPELLEYEQEYVERVKQAIDDKENEIEDMEDEIISNTSSNANNINMDNAKIISSSLYWFKKEIERIKYILHSYLRIRLWKIQKYVYYILSDEIQYNRLSQKEQKFAQKYINLNERHFKNCFLRDLPSKYQTLTEPEMIVKPNLNKFVVIKANENNDNILIENGKHHINLQKNNIFVARYDNFKHLIAQGTVDLI